MMDLAVGQKQSEINRYQPRSRINAVLQLELAAMLTAVLAEAVVTAAVNEPGMPDMISTSNVDRFSRESRESRRRTDEYWPMAIIIQ